MLRHVTVDLLVLAFTVWAVWSDQRVGALGGSADTPS